AVHGAYRPDRCPQVFTREDPAREFRWKVDATDARMRDGAAQEGGFQRAAHRDVADEGRLPPQVLVVLLAQDPRAQPLGPRGVPGRLPHDLRFTLGTTMRGSVSTPRSMMVSPSSITVQLRIGMS